jgi:phage tail-like protein
MPARDSDPLLGFHFGLELGGRVAGYFTELDGIGSEHELIEYKILDKQGNDIVQNLPGRLKWQPITLKRGITSMTDMWDWRKKVEDGDVDGALSNGTIKMYNQMLTIVAQWDFVNAWPSKISGPQMKADGNSIGIEQIVIVHEGIKRVK